MLEQALVEYACPDPDRTNRVSYACVSELETFQEIRIEGPILRFSPMPVFFDDV